MYGAKSKTGGYYTNAGYTSKEADGEKGDYVTWGLGLGRGFPGSKVSATITYTVQKLYMYVVDYKSAWQRPN